MAGGLGAEEECERVLQSLWNVKEGVLGSQFLMVVRTGRGRPYLVSVVVC